MPTKAKRKAAGYRNGKKVLLMGNGGSASEALSTAGDVVIGISTSGRSANISRGFEMAHALSCATAAFTGRTGGELAGRVDFLLAVP